MLFFFTVVCTESETCYATIICSIMVARFFQEGPVRDELSFTSMSSSDGHYACILSELLVESDVQL